MIGVVFCFSLVQSGDGVSDEVDVDDVNLVTGAKRKHGQISEKDKCLHHIELGCGGVTAIAEHDTWTENRNRRFRQEFADHVLAELLGAGVGIIVGAGPVDRPILGYDFVTALAGYGYSAHETA